MQPTREASPGPGAVRPPTRTENAERRHATPRRGREWLLRLLTAVAPRLLSAALRVLALTVRIVYTGADELFARWARGEQVIVAFWHNRALLMPLPYQGRGRKLCIMNSQHRDGEIATRALARWGIRSVRG